MIRLVLADGLRYLFAKLKSAKTISEWISIAFTFKFLVTKYPGLIMLKQAPQTHGAQPHAGFNAAIQQLFKK
jgi:hypothetical protein